MKYAEFTVGDLFIKKTVKGYPKSKENLTPVKNGYYVYGQNIKHQYNFKILMNMFMMTVTLWRLLADFVKN